MGAFELPANPFGRDGYFGRLSAAFGWKYVIVVMITYGLNQGGLSNWGRNARSFYFRDSKPQGLKLTPAQGLVVNNFGKLPWDLKAVFGVVSDAFAIRGLHRTPYILGAAAFGFIGWGLLGVLDQPGTGLVTLLVMLGNISIAVPDVMIDATIAQKCGEKPEHAVNLQSLGWGTLYAVITIAPLIFGPMYDAFGKTAKPIFLVCLIFPPILFFAVLFGWLGEKPDPNPAVKRAEFWDILKNAITLGRYQGKFADTQIESFQENVEKDAAMTSTNPKAEGHTFSAREEYLKFGKLYLLAMIISVLVFTAGLMLSQYGDDKYITIPIWLFCTGGICTALYVLMGPITYDLAYGAMYIFLRRALSPYGGDVLLYWNTDTSGDKKDNYNQCGAFNGTAVNNPNNITEEEWGLERPCLSTQFVTSIDSLGGLMGLVGIALYARYLSHWSYKKIFMVTAILNFAFSFLDLMWVTGAARDMGIPDEFMRIFNEEVAAEILGNWETLPMFVLAAKLCPKGMEATLFALLMGLSNFGNTMAAYMGSIVITELEISQGEGFDNLYLWILVRNTSALFVIALIPFLVPNGTPQDKSIYDDDESVADAEAVGIIGRMSIGEDALVEGAKRNSYAASL
jgi:hypothetical protein